MARDTLEISGRYWRYFPPDAPLGYAEERLALSVDKTAFVLIDVYGLRHGDDSATESLPNFYRPTAGDTWRTIVRERIVPAKAAARSAGLTVIYLTNHLSAGVTEASEWRLMSMRTCGVDVLEVWQPPTPILAFAKIIEPQPDEPIVHKQHYSGFFETELDSVLRSRGISDLVAVGFDSRICLSATLTDAMYRGYRVVALRDAIGTTEYPDTAQGGWASLVAERYLESNVGYTATTDDFISACSSVASP